MDQLEEDHKVLRTMLLANIKVEIQEIIASGDKLPSDGGTFLPHAYTQARLSGRSRENVLNDYDSCHIFR